MIRALVLGGGSGIGAACVEILRNKHNLDVYSPDHKKVDVTNRFNLVDAVENNGPYHFVVYSAGINRLDWIKDIHNSEMCDIFDVNVFGFIRLLNVLELHQPAVRPHIVAISSDAAVRPMRTSIAYCASKAALDMAVKCAARELGPKGWRINAVSPGMTDETGMTEYIDKRVSEVRGWTKAEALAYETSQQPLGRRATTGEIAHIVADVLMGPDYLNGAIIPVNGGR